MDSTIDDQDLMGALDGVDEAVASLSTPVSVRSGSSYIQSLVPTPAPAPAPAAPAPGSEPIVMPGSPVAPTSDGAETPLPDRTTETSSKPAPTDEALEQLKQDALFELRPLVDKLTVSPEEKFDTYLLLIRSTDDTKLIEPAHEAAKAIEDETRRAAALLDIIKEIDYLSQQKKKS